jgi:hypothetical protein
LFGNAYRLLADVAAAILLAFWDGGTPLHLRPRTCLLVIDFLHPARSGSSIQPSLQFIFIHNTARLLGESFYVAEAGVRDSWQPFISTVAGLWSGADAGTLLFGERLMFWLSIGAVVAFLPYFPYSKHIHLFFAPINFALKPERKSIGQLSYINLDDQSIEQFGAAKMKAWAGNRSWIVTPASCVIDARKFARRITRASCYRLPRWRSTSDIT